MEHKIKFYVKLQDNVTETFTKLTQAHGNQVISWIQDFKLH